MKILLVLDHLGKDSGVNSIVMNLYRHMDKSIIQMDFMIFRKRDDSYYDEVVNNGSKVFLLSNPLSFKSVFNGMKEIETFFKIHEGEYDIVHLHSATLNEFVLKPAKKYSVKHRIIHSHSTMTSPNVIKKFVNFLLQLNICRYANHFWACSREAAEFLYGKEYCKNNSFELIKNAVDTNRFLYNTNMRTEIRGRLKIEDELAVVHVSNFSKIKNVSFLTSVMEKSIAKRKDLRFIFVGDGPTKKEFEDQIAKHKLSNYCIFVGRTAEVMDYLCGADCLVLPSLKEGLPVTVIEAQANGLMCLISNTITKEVDCGNVTFLPLVSQKWIDKLIHLEVMDDDSRLNKSNDFSHSVFNIINEAKRVEKLYLEMR